MSSNKITRDLDLLPVDIDETTDQSNYFQVYDIKEVYSKGLHLITLRGSRLLKRDSLVYVEIKHEDGSVIPINVPPATTYERTLLPLVRFTFNITEEIPEGNCTITFIGRDNTNRTIRYQRSFVVNKRLPSRELHDRGDWVKGEFYEFSDIVRYNGVLYKTIFPHESSLPDESSDGTVPPNLTYWKVFTSDGADVRIVFETGNQFVLDTDGNPTIDPVIASYIPQNFTPDTQNIRWYRKDGASWESIGTQETVSISYSDFVNWKGNNEYLTIKVEVDDDEGTTYEDIASAISVEAGVNARSVRIEADSQIVREDQDGDTVPFQIELVPILENIDDDVKWIFDNTEVTSTNTTDNVYLSGDNLIVKEEAIVSNVLVVLEVGNLSDRIRLVRLLEGKDTFIGILDREQFAVATDKDGNILGGELDNVESTLTIFRGIEDVTEDYDIEVSITGDGTVNEPQSNTYSVTAMDSDTLIVRLIATHATFPTIEKVFSVVKQRQGERGFLGLSLLFRGQWESNVDYFRTSTSTDVVDYNGTYYYLPEEFGENTSTDSNPTADPTDWAQFEAQFESIATDILLARDVTIRRTLTMGEATGGTQESGGIIQSVGGYDENGVFTTDDDYIVQRFYKLDKDGINAHRGEIGGLTLAQDKLYLGEGEFDNENTSFYVDDSGRFSLKDELSWNGSDLNIRLDSDGQIISGRQEQNNDYVVLTNNSLSFHTWNENQFDHLNPLSIEPFTNGGESFANLKLGDSGLWFSAGDNFGNIARFSDTGIYLGANLIVDGNITFSGGTTLEIDGEIVGDLKLAHEKRIMLGTSTAGIYVPFIDEQGNIVDARVQSSTITQHEGDIDHNELTNYDINEHRTINDSATGSTDLWSASKINSDLDTKTDKSTTLQITTDSPLNINNDSAQDLSQNRSWNLSLTRGSIVQGSANRVQVSGDLTNRLVGSGDVTFTLPQDIHTGANVTFNQLSTQGNVSIGGDLEVLGDETIFDTETVQTEATHILVNRNGSDTSANGAGIRIERTGDNGSLVYDQNVTSLWKAGNLGSEIELVNISSEQTLTNKTGDKSLTGTANQIIVTGGNNVLLGEDTSLELPQDIHSGANPSFVQLDLGNQATLANHVVRADREITIQGTTNRISVNTITQDLTGDPSYTLDLPQDIHTLAVPTFNQITANNSSTDNNHVVRADSTVTLTGKENQIYIDFDTNQLSLEENFVSNNPSFTLELPQDIHAQATPDFTQLIIGSQATITDHAVRADRTIVINGTQNQISVDNSSQNLTGDLEYNLTLPQDIHEQAVPTFNQITLNNAGELTSSAVRADRSITINDDSDSVITWSEANSGTNLTSDRSWTPVIADHGENQRGVINTTSQNIYGEKTFLNKLIVNNSSYENHLELVRDTLQYRLNPSTGNNSGSANELRFESPSNNNRYWFDGVISGNSININADEVISTDRDFTGRHLELFGVATQTLLQFEDRWTLKDNKSNSYFEFINGENTSWRVTENENRFEFVQSLPQSSDWNNRLQGWAEVADPRGRGYFDFRGVFADEMIVRTFISETTLSLAGSDFLSKSNASVSEPIVIDSLENPITITVDDHEGLKGFKVFDEGDYLRLRIHNRFETGEFDLVIMDLWGKATNYVDNEDGTQQWTVDIEFPEALPVSQVSLQAGSVILDYGVSGDGLIERSATGAGTPYDRIFTWSDKPWISSNYEVKTQIGALGNTGGYYSEEFLEYRDSVEADGGEITDVEATAQYFNSQESQQIFGGYFKDQIMIQVGDENTMNIGKNVGGLGRHGYRIDGNNYHYGTGEFKVFTDEQNVIDKTETQLIIKSETFDLQAGKLKVFGDGNESYIKLGDIQGVGDGQLDTGTYIDNDGAFASYGNEDNFITRIGTELKIHSEFFDLQSGSLKIVGDVLNSYIKLGDIQGVVDGQLNTGTYIDNSGNFVSYGDEENYIRKNGTTLDIKSSTFDLKTTNISLTDDDGGKIQVGNVFQAIGNINEGYIAGFNFTENTFYNGAGDFGNLNTPLYFNSYTDEFSLGEKLTWDGSTLLLNTTEFFLNAGNLNIVGDGASSHIKLGSISSVIGTTSGTYMDNDGNFVSYGNATNYIRRNGTSLDIKSETFNLDADNVFISSDNNGQVLFGNEQSEFIKWNGTTGELEISGRITIVNNEISGFNYANSTEEGGNAINTDKVGDKTASEVDDGTGRSLGGLDNEGNVQRILDSSKISGTLPQSGSGLALTDSALGFYDSGSITGAYITNNGSFFFQDENGDGISFDSGISNFTISAENGSIRFGATSLEVGSGVWINSQNNGEFRVGSETEYIRFNDGTLLVETENFSIDDYGDVFVSGTVTATDLTATGTFSISGDNNTDFWDNEGNFQFGGENGIKTVTGGIEIGSSVEVKGDISGSTGTFSGTVSGGDINIGDGNFIVDTDGVMSATGATVSGTITSDDAELGGWIVDTFTIHATNPYGEFYGLSSEPASSFNEAIFFSGASDSAGNNATFYVDGEGNIHSEGTITSVGGSIISGNSEQTYIQISDEVITFTSWVDTDPTNQTEVLKISPLYTSPEYFANFELGGSGLWMSSQTAGDVAKFSPNNIILNADVTVNGNFTFSGEGSIIIDEEVTGNFTPATDDTYVLGTSDKRWKEIHATESYFGGIFETGLKSENIKEYETGTVLVWNKGKLMPCNKKEDKKVQGIAKNGKEFPIVMGAEPVLVTGKVKEGDYLTTSTVEGHAQKIKENYFGFIPRNISGKVIAQALEDSDGSKSCKIKAMISKI